MSHTYIQQEKAAKNNIEQIIAENISHDLNLNFLIKWTALGPWQRVGMSVIWDAMMVMWHNCYDGVQWFEGLYRVFAFVHTFFVIVGCNASLYISAFVHFLHNQSSVWQSIMAPHCYIFESECCLYIRYAWFCHIIPQMTCDRQTVWFHLSASYVCYIASAW